MARAIASHRCDLGSISGQHVLSFLFSSLLRVFCSGFADFPPCTKTNTSKFQFDLRTVNEEPFSVVEMSQPIPIIIVVVVVVLLLIIIIETFSSSRFPRVPSNYPYFYQSLVLRFVILFMVGTKWRYLGRG